MKPGQWALILIVGVVLGAAIGGRGQPRAAAQGREQSPIGRYQISAWAVYPNEREPYLHDGCFLVDTVSGELWELRKGGNGREWEKVTAGPRR